MKTVLAFTCASFLFCAALFGQSTAQIHGVVQDASGSAVPGAEVIATQTATGVNRNTMSGADGGFVLTNLPLGPFQLEIVKDGFTREVQSGIELWTNPIPDCTSSMVWPG